jgi:AcrR family transcriptional regulator
MDLRARHEPLDLRTRKRIGAMQHIQRVALDLFDADGYEAVTVSEIAEQADVGERSIYRYFGTKPMIVLHDEIDQQTLDVFAHHVASLPVIEAVARTIDDVAPLFTDGAMDDARRRLDLVHQHRELRAAMATYIDDLGDALGDALAEARAAAPDRLTARIHGRCIVTALAVAVDDWFVDPDPGTLLDRLHCAISALTSLTIGSSPSQPLATT